MLLEHINHYNNLHFAIEFSSIAQEAPHYHSEMELALVLRGSARYKVHHQDFHVKAGAIFVVDTQDLHYIYDSSEDLILLQLYVDMAFFKDVYPNIDVMFFVCEEFEKDSVQRHQLLHNKIAFLSRHIAEMMILRQKENNDALLSEKLREFIYIMVDQFQAFFIENNEFHHGREDTNPLDLERLYRIMHHMYGNYDKKITLSDIAAMEHLNLHYVSHLIKKTSGLSFQKLLNYIRVEQAEKFLNESRMTLTQISEYCGFSSLAYFNKCFHAWHNMTPAQYRKQPKPSERRFHGIIDREEALVLLQPYLNEELAIRENHGRGFSTQHLFIPQNQKKEQNGMRDFHRAFPLYILMDTPEELQQLSYYKEELLKLMPAGLILNTPASSHTQNTSRIIGSLKRSGLSISTQDEIETKRIRSCHAQTVAEAFDDVLKKPELFLRSFSDRCGLFRSDGLPSPYYSLYSAFAGLDGLITEKQGQYLMLTGKKGSCLMVYQTDSAFDLHIHLRLQMFENPRFLLKKTFDAKRNISGIMKYLGMTPDDGHQALIDDQAFDHILLHLAGDTEFIAVLESTNRTVDFTVRPNELILLLIKS